MTALLQVLRWAPTNHVVGRDRQPLGGQQLPHARIVGHLRERAGVRPAAAAAASAAVVGRLVRVVQADRSVADDEHERREPIANADIFEDTPDDIRHLAHGESGILPDRRRFVLAIQLQAGSCRSQRGVSCTRRHRDESHGNTTRRTSGTSASQPNAVISTAPRTGSRLPRCTL